MPEDDPRNAAVIADLSAITWATAPVYGRRHFESYEVTIVSGLILGVTLTLITGHNRVHPLPVAGSRHWRGGFHRRHLSGENASPMIAATPCRPSSAAS